MRRWSARSAREAVEALLLPAECLLCRGLLAGGASGVVCAVCRHRWRPVRPPWCERCGQPEPHFGPCRLCRDWPPALVAVRSAVWFADGARRAVIALKYGGLPRIAVDLAAAMPAPRLIPERHGTEVLVPIPLAPRRLRARGYNQSAVLADAVAARWGAPVRGLLTRTRETPSQTALTPEERLANVAGAFAVTETGAGPLTPGCQPGVSRPWPSLVLVDDVFTTGATLAAAAAALQRAGARTVYGVTFARAALPDFT